MSYALAAAPHAAAFNGLFYATIATVIPVLFVAIAVQGGAYTDIIARGGEMALPLMRRSQAAARAAEGTRRQR